MSLKFIEIGYRNNSVIYPCTPRLYCLCNKSLLKKRLIYIQAVRFVAMSVEHRVV